MYPASKRSYNFFKLHIKKSKKEADLTLSIGHDYVYISPHLLNNL